MTAAGSFLGGSFGAGASGGSELGYINYQMDQAQLSVDQMRKKMEMDSKDAANRAENSVMTQQKGTQIFSPSSGSSRSAAGEWAEDNTSAMMQSLNLMT